MTIPTPKPSPHLQRTPFPIRRRGAGARRPRARRALRHLPGLGRRGDTILRGRAPLLCRLGVGPLKITSTDECHVLLIDGGFAQMVEDRLTVLTEQAREPFEVERESAVKTLGETKARPITDEISWDDRDRAIRRAQAEIKLAS